MEGAGEPRRPPALVPYAQVPGLDRGGNRYVVGVTEDITAEREAREALNRSKAELEQNLIELKKSRAVSARTLASYQQRALQMEIIRQQNEDLDRLAQDLARAKKLEEERAQRNRDRRAAEERVSRELLARDPDALERHPRLLRAVDA